MSFNSFDYPRVPSWGYLCFHVGLILIVDVCYKPARDSTPEQIELRKECVKNYDNTSHDPLLFRPTGSRISGKLTEDEQTQPRDLPVFTDRMKKLAGIEAY